jgi:hypothetical protein
MENHTHFQSIAEKTADDKGWLYFKKLMKAELPAGDCDNDNATYLTNMNEGSCILYLCKFPDEQNNV